MRTSAIVLLVSSLFASTAAVSVRDQQHWTDKLDATLTQVAKQGGTDPVSVLIRLQPGATDRFVSHLRQHGLSPTHVTTPDLIVVQLPPSMLRRVAADHDVVRLSSDAVVDASSSLSGGNLERANIDVK